MIMMMKIVLCLVLTAVVAHKPHPMFLMGNEDYIVRVPRNVECSSNFATERDRIIEKSNCGDPREVLTGLKQELAHEQMTPRAVWIKRCVGLCEYINDGNCVATETITKHIPIRIFNLMEKKERCEMYPIEEHVKCGCCVGSCAGTKVSNSPQKRAITSLLKSNLSAPPISPSPNFVSTSRQIE